MSLYVRAGQLHSAQTSTRSLIEIQNGIREFTLDDEQLSIIFRGSGAPTPSRNVTMPLGAGDARLAGGNLPTHRQVADRTPVNLMRPRYALPDEEISPACRVSVHADLR